MLKKIILIFILLNEGNSRINHVKETQLEISFTSAHILSSSEQNILSKACILYII